MSTLKKPDLTDTKLRAKLAKGMGHNYYGEPDGLMTYCTYSQWLFLGLLLV